MLPDRTETIQERIHVKILNLQLKHIPIQEDSSRKTAGPKPQLKMTNPRAYRKISNYQLKHHPIQEDSLRKKAGPKAQLKMTSPIT